MATQLDRSYLLRLGAEARLRELRAEIAAIEQDFPELRQPGASTGRRTAGAPAAAPHTAANEATAAATREPSPAKRARRSWTAAQRKAAAERMKAFWRKRKAKAK